MERDALTTFIEHTQRAFGPLTTELSASVRGGLTALAHAAPTEPWLESLHRTQPESKELHRDPRHGFILLAHTERPGTYRPPHDHGRSWVVYALQRGEMEIGTYARLVDPDGGVRLVQRDLTVLRAGEARVYLLGDIHDTRCVAGPSLLFRFTERDLKRETQMTRYVERNGSWTVGAA